MDKKKIYINFDSGSLIDDKGALVTSYPSLAYGANPTWELNFVRVDDNGTLQGINLSDAVSFRGAVDNDFLSGTAPMLRVPSSDFELSGAASGIIGMTLDAATQEFLSKVNGRQSTLAYTEVVGKDSNGKPIYFYQFRTNCLMSIDPEIE